MARVLKRSTTKVPNTLKSGNVAIGVNNVNYGPTSVTGFYSGVPVPDGGYSVYKTFSNGKFAAYAPQNDVELLRVLNHLGANSTTITQALAWAATQSEIAITAKSYDNIITDNLILNLDSRFINSYPRTGSTWYDINGDPNNCTLFNSPTYSDELLQFDGINDYGQINNAAALQITGDQTLEFVVYPRRRDRRQNWYDKAYGGEGTITYEPAGSLNYYWGTAGSNNTPYQGVNTSGAPLATLNKWYHVVLVRELSTPTRTVKWYINGVLNSTTSASYTAATASPFNIRIGLGYTTYFQGDIQTVRIYNKALSQAEVLQNYYRAPIITSGLVFAISPSNVLSYDRVSTTTNSLVGTNTGTLVNGVGFQNINKGVWFFDNTNDYISLPNSLGYSTNALSVFAWFRSNGSPAAGYHIICGGEELEISIPWPSGQLRTGVRTNTRFVSNHGTVNLNDGKWHHIGFTFNGSVKTSYIDGVNVGTQNTTGTLTTSFSNRFIGRFGSSTQYYANGYLGGYLVYNKVLTDLEVKQNYDAQSQRFI